MCIIVYKPKGQQLPSKRTLQTCWNNNPDGAGYMFPNDKGRVSIRKGFMSFHEFYSNLMYDFRKFGNVDFVMHFRISTQGGVNQQCCHPFPLSRKMDELKYLRCHSNIGIAHNGIIDLTTTYGKVDYSDTMKFITDYLTLIIKDRDFYKDEETLLLIERLAGSKLAIMDGTGHTTLIGDFTMDKGCYYSNEYYKEPRVRARKTIPYYKWDEWDDWEEWNNRHNISKIEEKKGQDNSTILFEDENELLRQDNNGDILWFNKKKEEQDKIDKKGE